MSDSVTNVKLYERLDQIRLELKGDIVKLEAKVDTVLNEELQRAKDEINNLKVKYATITTKLGILGFITATVVGAGVSVLMNRIVP